MKISNFHHLKFANGIQEETVIIFTVSLSFDLKINTNSYKIKKSTLIWIPSRLNVQFSLPDKISRNAGWIIHSGIINLQKKEELKILQLKREDCIGINKLLRILTHFQKRKFERFPVWFSFLIRELDYYFVLHYQSYAQNAVHNKYYFQFLELLEDAYTQSHQVNFYAGKLALSPGSLNRILKKSSGHTAKEIIDAFLYFKAIRLFEFENMPISVISDSLGFSSPSVFTHFFKNKTGLNPLEFRIKLKNHENITIFK